MPLGSLILTKHPPLFRLVLEHTSQEFPDELKLLAFQSSLRILTDRIPAKNPRAKGSKGMTLHHLLQKNF